MLPATRAALILLAGAPVPRATMAAPGEWTGSGWPWSWGKEETAESGASGWPSWGKEETAESGANEWDRQYLRDLERQHEWDWQRIWERIWDRLVEMLWEWRTTLLLTASVLIFVAAVAAGAPLIGALGYGVLAAFSGGIVFAAWENRHYLKVCLAVAAAVALLPALCRCAWQGKVFKKVQDALPTMCWLTALCLFLTLLARPFGHPASDGCSP